MPYSELSNPETVPPLESEDFSRVLSAYKENMSMAHRKTGMQATESTIAKSSKIQRDDFIVWIETVWNDDSALVEQRDIAWCRDS